MLYESNFGSGPTLHDVYPLSLLYVVKVVKWYYAGWNLVDRQQREREITNCKMWKERSAAAGFKPCMWKLSSLINPAAVGKGSGDSILA